MKSTPGPWTFEEHGGTFYIFGPESAMVADNNDEEGWAKETLARIRGVGRGATDEEKKANARLIAAAPDLLLELTRLSREVGGILYGFELELREAIGNTNFAVLKQKVKEAEAAIQKAEGQ